MADEAEIPNTEEELLLDTPVEPEAPEAPEAEADEEEILTFGDSAEEEASTDNAVIRHLREELKRARKEAAEAKKPKADDTPEDVGPEPTLEQFDWDEDRYRAAMREHTRKELAAEQRKSQSTSAQEAEVEATRQRIEAEKAALNRPDVEDAFEIVRDTLSEQQQSALVATVDHGNTAKLIYALAKNPERLASLASEQNLARFIKQVGQLEGTLKMVKRRKAPEPDVPERGSGKPSVAKNAAQKQLEKMEAEYKGGDRTHIQKFKRENGLK